MDSIDIVKNYDGHGYTVKSTTWVKKEEIRRKHTVSKLAAQVFEFDDSGFTRDMIKETVLIDGKPITDADIASWDAHSGEVVVRAVNLLNGLSVEEQRNLKLVPSWTIQRTP